MSDKLHCIMCARNGKQTTAVKSVTESISVDLAGETHHASSSGPVCEKHLNEVNARETADPARSVDISDLPGGGNNGN